VDESPDTTTDDRSERHDRGPEAHDPDVAGAGAGGDAARRIRRHLERGARDRDER